MKSLELFTGAGGLALGTHLAGFKHTALLEWDHDACETLRHNSKANAVAGLSRWNVEEADIRNANFSQYRDVELVAGGVPCQPFSIGGKHKGMDDMRDMFPDFVRAIRTLQPRAFIVENVKGLLRQTFRNYFSYIVLQLSHPEVGPKRDEAWEEHLKRLEDFHTRGRSGGLKYNVVFRLLNAANYGVPQTRERVFMVGFRSDIDADWHFPEATHSEDALVHSQHISGEYWDKHNVRKPKSLRGQSEASLARARQGIERNTKPWRTVRDAIDGLPKPDSKESRNVLNHWLNPGARAYVGHTGSFIDWPSKTLKAGVHGVPGGENMIAFEDGSVRYLTVREAARIQTFPDTWCFQGAWSEAMRQLGNAVPVDLAAVVAKSVARRLMAMRRATAAVNNLSLLDERHTTRKARFA